MKTVENETNLKIGDQVMITRDQIWPGVAKYKGAKGKSAGLVPMGSKGTLEKAGEMWVIVFPGFPTDPDWPCIVCFYPAKLPDWVVRSGAVQLEFPMTEKRQDDWILAHAATMEEAR